MFQGTALTTGTSEMAITNIRSETCSTENEGNEKNCMFFISSLPSIIEVS